MKKTSLVFLGLMIVFVSYAAEVSSDSNLNDGSGIDLDVGRYGLIDFFHVDVAGTFKLVGGSYDLEWSDTGVKFVDDSNWDAGFETISARLSTPLGNLNYEFSPGFYEDDYSYSGFRYLPFSAIDSMSRLAELGYDWAEPFSTGLMFTLPTYGYEKITTPIYESTSQTFGLYLNALTYRRQSRIYSNISSDFNIVSMETESSQFGLFTSEVLKTISEMWVQYATTGGDYILDEFPGVEIGGWNVLPAPILDLYYQRLDYTFDLQSGPRQASASGWSGSIGASLYAISRSSSLLDIFNYRVLLTAYYQYNLEFSKVDSSADLPRLVGEKLNGAGSEYYVQLHFLASF